MAGDPDHINIPPHLLKLRAVQELEPSQRPTRAELIAIIAKEFGYNVRQQAEIFSQSEKTVRTHQQRAHQKVYCDNVTEAIWLIEHSRWYNNLRDEIEAEITRRVQIWKAKQPIFNRHTTA